MILSAIATVGVFVFDTAYKFVHAAAVKLVGVAVAEMMERRRSPPPEQPELSIVAESHLSASTRDRALLRMRLGATNERHPEFRDLKAAIHASCEEDGGGEEKEEEGETEEGGGEEEKGGTGEGGGEEEKRGEEEEEKRGKGEEEEKEEEEEEVDALQKEVAEALSESSRMAREDLQATTTSANDLRNALQSMRAKLAAADEAEGKSDMKRELLDELEALAEADIGAATLCDDQSVGMVGLHALMASRFRDQCEHAEREMKQINDKDDKDLAEILRSEPGEDLSERSVEQLIAAIEAEREEEGRTLQALVRQATEDTAAAKSREQGYEERYIAAECSLTDEQKDEVEDKKTCDAVLSELREFVNRAPALLQEIGEVKRAVVAVTKRKDELVPRERELKEELENL